MKVNHYCQEMVNFPNIKYFYFYISQNIIKNNLLELKLMTTAHNILCSFKEYHQSSIQRKWGCFVTRGKKVQKFCQRVSGFKDFFRNFGVFFRDFSGFFRGFWWVFSGILGSNVHILGSIINSKEQYTLSIFLLMKKSYIFLVKSSLTVAC